MKTKIDLFSKHFMTLKGYKFSEEYKKKMSQIKMGHFVSEETAKKIGNANRGKKRTEETKEKMRQAKLKNPTNYWLGRKRVAMHEENNLNWKGDNVGYHALHNWVSRNLGTPNICEHCGKSGLKGRYIDWANKSQKYLRDLSDWIRLCKSCHKIYDLNFLKND